MICEPLGSSRPFFPDTAYAAYIHLLQNSLLPLEQLPFPCFDFKMLFHQTHPPPDDQSSLTERKEWSALKRIECDVEVGGAGGEESVRKCPLPLLLSPNTFDDGYF